MPKPSPGHAKQLVALELLVELSGQDEQDGEVDVLVKVPAVQLVHMLLPVPVAYVPGSQLVQLLAQKDGW